jgi:hypothetical protein
MANINKQRNKPTSFNFMHYILSIIACGIAVYCACMEVNAEYLILKFLVMGLLFSVNIYLGL